ncbi:MAG: hypothetical protein KAS17_10235 [Victivallaceae bacterium]|nr:hypothetical protein [Victivallaceae bacterium]
MSKIKYYQLAFKDGKYQKSVSPNQEKLDALTADGWELHGFDNEADIPQKPILDNGAVRAMTEAEIAAKILADKLAQTVFDQMDILKAFDGLGKKTELLNLLSTNAEFATYWAASKTGIDLKHPVCVQAIAALGLTEQINAVKLAISGE